MVSEVISNWTTAFLSEPIIAIVVNLFSKLLFGKQKFLGICWLLLESLYKSGDVYDFINYRSIMNNCTFENTYSALHNSKPSTSFEESCLFLGKQQGARHARSKNENVFVMQQIRNVRKLREKQCIMVFRTSRGHLMVLTGRPFWMTTSTQSAATSGLRIFQASLCKKS